MGKIKNKSHKTGFLGRESKPGAHLI